MTKEAIKAAVKEALAETLAEHRELLHEVLSEALEDLALAEAIRAGRDSKMASRREVFRMLPNKCDLYRYFP